MARRPCYDRTILHHRGIVLVGLVRNKNMSEQQEISGSGYDITPLSAEAIERLAQDLNEEEYRILLDHGTEPAFCGTLLDNKMDGTYACRLCGLPLFSSEKKFHSGTGTNTGAPLSLMKNTTNFAGLVLLAFLPTT